MGFVEMLTNALANMLSSTAEKLNTFIAVLPIAFEVGIGRAFVIIFSFAGARSFNFVLALGRGAFFFADLQRRQLWYFRMECHQQWRCWYHLYHCCCWYWSFAAVLAMKRGLEREELNFVQN
jgi:hypothetical protein